MARNRAVFDLGRALSDGDGIDDLTAPLAAKARFLGPPDHSPCSQMPDELLLEHASSLNEEASVDGFVGDLHLLVVRVSPLQPPRDLLRCPIEAQLPGHNLLQSPVNRQPTRLRATCPVPGPLISVARSISLPTAMASDLPAHRGGRALDRSRDLPHRMAFREAP